MVLYIYIYIFNIGRKRFEDVTFPINFPVISHQLPSILCFPLIFPYVSTIFPPIFPSHKAVPIPWGDDGALLASVCDEGVRVYDAEKRYKVVNELEKASTSASFGGFSGSLDGIWWVFDGIFDGIF